MRTNRSRLARLRLGAAGFTALVLLGAHPLGGAELRVRGLGLIGNRVAAERLRELIGNLDAPTLEASAIEDSALVLLTSQQDAGFQQATLTAVVTLADGREASYPLDAGLDSPLPRPLAARRAVLHINRGRRFTLEEITFTGLSALSVPEARGFFVGQDLILGGSAERAFAPGRLQTSLGNLEEALRQQGFADAKVTAGQVLPDPATGRVKLTVAVQEGRRWLVENLDLIVAGEIAVPTSLAASRLNQPWNARWRQDTAAALRRHYYALGYPDVAVTLKAQSQPGADGRLGVTVQAEVTPGPRVQVGSVTLTGHRYTREATLRRLIGIGAGEPLDPVRFSDSQARLSLLGIFRTVDLRYEPVDEQTRNAVFTLAEGRRQEVSLIAGYGSFEQFRGGLEWRHYNLLGRAHSGILRAGKSVKSDQADYTYSIPELFGTAQTGTAELFGLRRRELAFVHEEYGANVTVLWPLRRLGLSLTTGYTSKRVFDVDNILATRASDRDEVNVGSLNLGLVRDRLDNPLRPRRGYRLSLQSEIAARALGGGTVYQQVVAETSYHTAWGRGRWIHVGLAHGLVTTLGASNDSALPVSVRFFPGGEDSLRGYRKGEAAPRAANGQFVGAKSYVQASVEVEQAITRNWSVVAFVDGVGTAARLADYPFAESLYSVGLGLRYQTIIGPIRLEFGHNLNPRPLDPDGTLLVSIGFPF